MIKYHDSSLTCVIMSIISVIIKLYFLSVILCLVSRHSYRAVCFYSSSVFVVVCMLQYVQCGAYNFTNFTTGSPTSHLLHSLYNIILIQRVQQV